MNRRIFLGAIAAIVGGWNLPVEVLAPAPAFTSLDVLLKRMYREPIFGNVVTQEELLELFYGMGRSASGGRYVEMVQMFELPEAVA